MNAMLSPSLRLRRMVARDVAAVAAIEAAAYGFPWSRGNFIDSLAAGYLAEVMVTNDGSIAGYFVAMHGADEMHLLNLTVAPAWQRRGLARTLLDALDGRCRTAGVPTLWLEVRASNQRARLLYRRRGFAEVGTRPGYYPAPHSGREDAVVMSARIVREGDDAAQ